MNYVISLLISDIIWFFSSFHQSVLPKLRDIEMWKKIDIMKNILILLSIDFKENLTLVENIFGNTYDRMNIQLCF